MAESRKERKIVAVPSHPETVRHLTIAERAARGKAARAEVPRSSQAEVEFPRRRDPIALLEEQALSRVPELREDARPAKSCSRQAACSSRASARSSTSGMSAFWSRSALV